MLLPDLSPNFSLWSTGPICRRSLFFPCRTCQICTWSSRSPPLSTSRRCQLLHFPVLLDAARLDRSLGRSALWGRHWWVPLHLQLLWVAAFAPVLHCLLLARLHHQGWEPRSLTYLKEFHQQRPHPSLPDFSPSIQLFTDHVQLPVHYSFHLRSSFLIS